MIKHYKDKNKCVDLNSNKLIGCNHQHKCPYCNLEVTTPTHTCFKQGYEPTIHIFNNKICVHMYEIDNAFKHYKIYEFENFISPTMQSSIQYDKSQLYAFTRELSKINPLISITYGGDCIE